MDRRNFLALGALLPATVRIATDSPEPDHTEAPAQPPIPDEPSIVALQAAMASGALTSRALTERYLARIDAIDRTGPALRCVIEVNPDALRLADDADAARKAGRSAGPLHGIPILIKDNIDTADRMRTTAGSLALADWTPPRDAFLVERLRAAGAVLLGKTNLSEWANFRSTRSTSGWSSRGGQTKNPYVLDRNPCGSSSGSGAAVAANLCAAAIGTETDGSIVCPANMAGLVGIKPTVGLVSRSGIIPISESQDTAGPMARSVADAAVLLAAIAGVDPRDPATARGRGRVSDYAGALQPGALKGARIGVLRNLFGFQPAVDALMEEAIGVLRGNGAVMVDPADFPTKGKFDDDEFTVLLHEFKVGLNAYLATLPATAPARTLEQLISWNDAHKATVMPHFGQEIFIRSQATSGLKAPAYLKARASCIRQSRTLGFDALFARYRLVAAIAPTGSPAWPTDHLNGDHFTGGSSTPSAVAGYPAVTVPAGFVGPLPVGITFMGPAWSEATLIGIAYAFEQVTHHRRPPRHLATI